VNIYDKLLDIYQKHLLSGACDPECETCMETMCRCDRSFSFNDTKCQRCWLPYCETCSKSYYCDSCISDTYGSKYCDRSCDYICRDYRNGIEVCRFSDDTCYMCKDGYYLNQTTVTCVPCNYSGCKTCSDATRCETCNAGYWGTQCNLTCSSGCVNNTCHKADGSCVCIEGNFGKQCQHECAYTCASSSLDMNQTLCNHITGECTHCQTGYFGRFCENQCSKSCDQTKCYAEDGNCSMGCILNYYGPRCEFSCSTNCKGTNNWVVCDANGTCLGGCVDGYNGDKCLTGEKRALKCIIANLSIGLSNEGMP